MKKFYLLIFLTPFLFSSCDKNKNADDPEVFSQKSVEENKAIIETSGLDMMNAMDDLAELDAIEVCVNLGERLDRADPFETLDLKQSKLNTTLHAIAKLDYNQDLNFLFTNILDAGELSDPQSIQELWDEIVGTYTWNAELEEWDFEAGSDEVILLFPAMDNSTTNDGKVRIFGYEGVTISNPIEEEYEGDIPTAIAFEISYNNTVLINFAFAAQYDSEGIPSMVAGDLTISAYKWMVDFTRSNTEVSSSYKFTQGDQVLIELRGTGKGLFTEDNVNDNIVPVKHYYTDWVYNPDTQDYEPVKSTEYWESEELMFEEVINAVNVRFQMFNLLIKGEVDIKKLADEIRKIEDNEWEYEEKTNDDKLADSQKEADAINNYLSLKVLNAQSNEIIAEIEAYVVSETNEWDNFDTWIDFRFKFGDESTVDAETYFNDGFDNFIDEINNFINDLNNNYDLGLEGIDY
jgi:hypothetical protein